jgi:hypothetical protein
LKPRSSTVRVVLFAAKCYWPGVTQGELEQITARVAGDHAWSARDGVVYCGSLLFSDDELVLFLFEGPSRSVVKRASERVGLPCERLMGATWRSAEEPILKGRRA